MVLAGPEQAANVGFAARTLACYGVDDFRIVGSPDPVSSDAARKTAKGASHILASARHFETLPAAIEDCRFAFGFTRRTREPAQRIHDLEDAVASWREAIGPDRTLPEGSGVEPGSRMESGPRTALVFGRESQGLSREETLALSHLVRIPMPDEVLSLNLSHAVAIGLYAFLGTRADAGSAAQRGNRLAEGGEDPPSARKENAEVLETLLAALDGRGFFRGGKEAAQREYTRILWQRLNPTRRELDFLAGMLKRLAANS